MSLSSVYTTGVIAVKEKALLKERLYRLADMTVEEAFRALLEYGYGGGAETAASPYDYEALIAFEERAIDEFIYEYAPSEEISAYFLSPRDFHNAKALFKAKLLSVSPDKLLASEGLYPISLLASCIASSDYSSVKGELKTALEEAEDLALEGNLSGIQIGLIFDKACYRHLTRVCKKNKTLRRFLAQKVDMINILTTVRALDFSSASSQYLSGGKLSEDTLKLLFEGDEEKIKSAFLGTPYAEFVKICLESRGKNRSLAEAERILGGYETQLFYARRYELKREEPFLYYILQRRTENSNIRIIFAGKIAGLTEREIKVRLRAKNGGTL